MAPRPPSSSGGRPFTSSGHAPGPARPSTATGRFDRDQHYTYEQEYDIEEEEEESDDDNPFAFLPPTTADRERAEQLQQQSQHQPSQSLYPDSYQHNPPYQEHSLQNAFPLPEYVSPNSPEQLFTIFPSQAPLYSIPYPTPSNDSSYRPPHLPVESPPSTGSYSAPEDPYRLHRINPRSPGNETNAPTTNSVAGQVERTPLPSREVHVALPPPSPAGSDRGTYRSDSKRRPSSISDSVTPSVLDPESSSGQSIKIEYDFPEEDDSPYPEVRASVSNIDDPDMPALTFRMWLVGLLLCMTSSALNVFFNFRSPAPTVVPIVLLLISYPFGKLLAFTLPITTYRIPLPAITVPFLPSLSRPAQPIEFSFNPGPWNIKEHVLVYIMANVATGPPYALNAIVVSEMFYEIKLGYWFNLVLVLATQLTGFGLAGLCRRFLVWPASMVWPQNLVVCTMLNTLHADEDEGTGGITRYKYFMIVLAGSFVWFFLPDFLFQALSVFSFICWAAPKNVPVNQMFGVHSGLGMSVVTFDWTQISWIGSPLMYPWWAEVHIFTGFVLFFWILTPILYYTNTWQLSYFPISDNVPYDRFGNKYNITRVLKTDDTFNLTAYEAYSPLFLPATYTITYLLAFALSTCVIVHTVLYHGRSLLNGFKKIRTEKEDIHAHLMKNYPEVPNWWYATAFVLFFGLAVIAVEIWHTGVPIWALLLAVSLAVIYVLPSGFIYAMTGQGITLNILAQIIPGSLLPGNPLANMVFKAYAVQTLSEATSFVQDLKLGHYIKVPPRATFTVQAVSTILAAFVQVGVKHWIFNNVPDICQPNQKSSLTCPHNTVFFTASAIWGLIGPSRQFGSGSIYHPQLYAIGIGGILPIPFWLYQRRYPDSWVRYVNIPVILNGVSNMPPATGINYSSWFAVGFVFQYWIRKKNFAWWSKFNYVTSAALDSGTVLSLIFIFFTLQFPKSGGVTVNWWGNDVFKHNADWNRTPFRQVPAGGIPYRA